MRWGLALVLAIVGCAALQPEAPEVVAVDRVVGEALSAARAPAHQQKAALARAQAAFSKDSGALNRLRLATLLAALPAPLRDEARAAQLLEPLANASAPGVGRFSALLAAQLAERERLSREIERLSRESERSTRERERLDKERDKREEALRQQLEAMQSIERGILEREEKLRRRQR